MMSNGTLENSGELHNFGFGEKNPYVLLKRWSVEDINCYLSKSITEREFFNNRRQLNGIGPNTSFDAYVSIERLRPQDIERFLNKSNEQ